MWSLGAYDIYQIKMVCEETWNDDGCGSIGCEFRYDYCTTPSYLVNYHLWIAYSLHYCRSYGYDSHYISNTIYEV